MDGTALHAGDQVELPEGLLQHQGNYTKGFLYNWKVDVIRISAASLLDKCTAAAASIAVTEYNVRSRLLAPAG